MVPSSLKEKWPKDYTVFREWCLSKDPAARVDWGKAERPVEFLKFLDDPPERKKSLLFVTHGAMSRALFDKWVRLALIYQALKGRHDGDELRWRLSRFMADILWTKTFAGWNESLCFELLKTPPERWLRRMQRWAFDPEGQGAPEEADDPVPKAVLDVLEELDAGDLFAALQGVPQRKSKHYPDRIREVRAEIQRVVMQDIWGRTVRKLELALPLVILDEAHHLKNPGTRLAGLFQAEEAEDDADVITKGPFAGVFERMLFLTATPFQLGHSELCSVLDRFDGIAWKAPTAPSMSRSDFAERTAELRRALDAAQLAALRLEHAWGQLSWESLSVDGQRFANVEAWWEQARGSQQLPEEGKHVLAAYRETDRRMRLANRLLRPWVVRHLKPRELSAENQGTVTRRRRRLSGRAIVATEEGADQKGIGLADDAVLPFLLAARATICAPESRPVFAEGLASCYEAFLHTRRRSRNRDSGVLDNDDEPITGDGTTDAQWWYLKHLDEILQVRDATESLAHPKVQATVSRTVDLWRRGEKVLIFCHYVATGRVLRQRVSEAIGREIRDLGAQRLGCAPEAVAEEISRIGERFFDPESPLRRAADGEILGILKCFPQLASYTDTLVEIIRRYLRTPSFLVRYSLLDKGVPDAEAVRDAMEARDASGLKLRDLMTDFFEFLAKRCTDEERERYIEALHSLQTGAHRGADVAQTFSEDELQGEHSERLLPNVRLVNGSTRQETRQKLMLTFNTPFYPEILVASSVMAEGVDLHLNCRYVIHHDLCWNPSTLEQRTGRIDRIGAKCERSLQPIHVYLPYISETQDEKMYRVVMDRERWFNVVMGENFKADVRTTERLAERIPFPETAAAALAFQLEAE